MKSLAKLLLIGIIAGLGILLWQRRSETKTPPPVEIVSQPAVIAATLLPAQPASRPPALIPAAQPPSPPPNPFEKTLVLLHLKLREWQAAQMNDPDDKDGRAAGLLQEMLAMVTDGNVADVIQSLSVEEMNTPFGTGALDHWAHADPVTASNWLAARPETTDLQTLTVADALIGNRDGLQQHINQMPDSAWKQSFLRDAGSELATKDPLAATRLAQQMRPGPDQTSLLQSVACDWVATDPNAALDWMTGVNDPALKEQLVAASAQSYALADPAQAAAWLGSSVKSAGLLKDAALNITQTWLTKDPAGAAGWVSQFPDGDTKTAAVDLVSKYWQQTDPAAATAWIQNLSGATTSPAN